MVVRYTNILNAFFETELYKFYHCCPAKVPDSNDILGQLDILGDRYSFRLVLSGLLYRRRWS